MYCMATVSQEQFDKWTPKQRLDYHTWCWFKDYGTCDNCAIKINFDNNNKDESINGTE